MPRPKTIETPAKDQFYAFRGAMMRVIDGDTVEICLDLGFGLYNINTFHLYGIDAPEKRTTAGKKAWLFLESLFPADQNTLVYVRTIKNRGNQASKEKFGRFLAEIYVNIDDLNAGFATSVNQKLVNEGLAKPYFGHGKRG